MDTVSAVLDLRGICQSYGCLTACNSLLDHACVSVLLQCAACAAFETLCMAWYTLLTANPHVEDEVRSMAHLPSFSSAALGAHACAQYAML